MTKRTNMETPPVEVAVRMENMDTPHGEVLGVQTNAEALATLYASQRYVPSEGRSRIAYPSARELVVPFLEKLRPLEDLGIDLRVQTTHPVTVQDPQTGIDHTAYGRFLVEASIGPVDLVDHRAVIGFVAALDKKGNPEVQAYSGKNAEGCINLLIFRRDKYLRASLLKGGEEAVFKMVGTFVDEFGQNERQFIEKVQLLQQTTWQEREINEKLGRLYREFLTKGNLASTLNYAVKLVSDSNSRYAIAPDGTITAWKFMSAMTQYVSDKAYPDARAEKTLEIVQAIAPELLEVKEEARN